MKKRVFLIPSLLAAGLLPQKAAALAPGVSIPKPDPTPRLFERFRLNHIYTLAAHRSHSSHSSHASHSSHRSSAGGGYSTRPYIPPAPAYTPPPTSNSMPSAPANPSPPSPSIINIPAPSTTRTAPAEIRQAPLKILPGNSGKFTEIVKSVQLGLYAYGYYSGAIDGIVGPETRKALEKMQSDWNLRVTGTITPEVLDSLRIAAQ
ncbi:His-Xaa-Ser repeat protein HxsA [Consotaella aegiceratis]|uniref:His-Xaa-Ser repeat protein HxsA n=1 Tax=Consotaella aegiceratis TaxID=3097961 RepID=UPI002F422255